MVLKKFNSIGNLNRIVLFCVIIAQLLNSSEAWFENCDHTLNLVANGSVNLNSPYYPNRYPAGSSCRYVIVAPLDYEINIQCNMEIDKPSSECSSDYFYIAVDGDIKLRNSEYFCGEGYIQRKSVFRQITIAYTSSTNKYAGRFSCLLQATPQPCDCGWSQQSRISGGVQAKINEYPFMSGVLHKPSNKVFCGAVLISHHFLTSAAHCFVSYRNPNELSVIVGDHDLRTNAETPYTRVHDVNYIVIHEKYTGGSGDHYDIALVRTATIVEWSRGVGPACLPFLYSFSSFAGMNADIVGWGTTTFAGAPSPTLQKATVKIISNDQCRPYYQTLSNSQICTYSPPKDSCQYDSGGPIVVRLNRLFAVGLISYGMACGTNTPAVNTRITEYLNWIQVNTRENFCQKN